MILDRIRHAPRARLLALAGAGVLLLGALWLNWTSPAAESRREAERRLVGAEDTELTPPPRVSVDATVLVESDARTTVDVAGVLAAARSVEIAAEVAGRVVAVPTADHTAVEAGQVLVQLDPALPEAAVKRAEAALLRAQAADRLAQSERRRQRDLSARGVASGAELDRAESEAKSAAARVAEASADRIDARARLEKTHITAPFDGVTSAIAVDPGAYLRPGDRIAEVADFSEIEIEVGVSEREILAVRDGDAVRVAVAALPGEWFSGRVKRRGRIPDPRTRKYPVPVTVPNPDGRLLPGMLGTVRFVLGEARVALRIPERAIVREFDLDHVYVLEPEDSDPTIAIATRRRIATRPLAFQPDLREIVSGLEAGERIAIAGVRDLRDGLRVRARDRQPAELASERAAPADVAPKGAGS